MTYTFFVVYSFFAVFCIPFIFITTVALYSALVRWQERLCFSILQDFTNLCPDLSPHQCRVGFDFVFISLFCVWFSSPVKIFFSVTETSNILPAKKYGKQRNRFSCARRNRVRYSINYFPRLIGSRRAVCVEHLQHSCCPAVDVNSRTFRTEGAGGEKEKVLTLYCQCTSASHRCCVMLFRQHRRAFFFSP